jgi:hypothetical protein
MTEQIGSTTKRMLGAVRRQRLYPPFNYRELHPVSTGQAA